MKITKPKKDRRSGLEKEIDTVLNYMQGLKLDSEEYQHMVAILLKMYSAKEFEPKHLSKDAVAIIAGNLLGIVLILGYEHGHIIASKAISFVLKGRV